MNVDGRPIAVIGSGISGLSAAYVLSRNGARVTLFEREARCGGHTLTDETSGWPVDLGFQVFNLTTYPNLVGMLEELGVESEESDMSFSLSMDGGSFEWSSSALFAQASNCTSPSFLMMLYEVLRFGREAPRVLEGAMAHEYESVTLGEYLTRHNYSAAFKEHYVLPMCAAVWSVPSATVLGFPVKMLVRFWVNHHLLDVFDRPLWRVVKGRSQAYVKAVLAHVHDVRAGQAVVRITRRSRELGPREGGVEIETADGKKSAFDAVVMATHSDVTLQLLGSGATDAEREVLGAIPYNSNGVWLHTDASLMPRRRQCWTSWNFLGKRGGSADSAVCVTYWLNRLQNLPADAPDLFVTLNPIHEPTPSSVIRRLSLDHPVFSQASVAAQHRLPEIQGTGGVYFCGAWGGYGFHEDGVRASNAVVVDCLGCRLPWNCMATSPKIRAWDRLALNTVDVFLKRTIKRGQLRLVLPDGRQRTYGPGLSAADFPDKENEWWGRPLPDCTLRVINASGMWKVITKHDTGLGEAWMDGSIVCKDPGALMAVLVANARDAEQSRGSLGLLNWVGDKLLLLTHMKRHNSVENSRKNIEEHYDAGNDMYKAFLDETMTYSCGIHAPGRSLRDAQIAKIDALISRAGIVKDDRVLEIGCGWGAFAIRAVQTTGCTVVGLTLSKEQLEEANRRVEEAGLRDRITLLFCDYRQCPGAGTYDRVVSCEMIEAVGHEYLESYFQTIGKMLRSGGRACIQAITMPDERYDEYCRSSDFIREHIFPGGHLPSIGAMVQAAQGTGLALVDVEDIGPHYAVTLREWRRRWEEQKDHVLRLGYSERFWRKYQFYFAYCEAAFDARYIHDYHVVWAKDSAVAMRDGQTQPLDDASLNIYASGAIVQDVWTQALASAWFFLAGIAAGRAPVMALVPASSAGFVALLMGIARTHAGLSPASAKLMSRPERSRMAGDVLQVLYAVAMTVAAGLFLAHHAPAMQDPRYASGLFPSVLVCIAAGHMASKLWFEVQRPILSRRVPVIVLRAALLSLFTAAAYSLDHTAMLATSLVAEGASVAPALGRLLQLRRGPSPKRALAACELLSIVAMVLVPHAWIGRGALAHMDAFRTPLFAMLAVSALALNGAVAAARGAFLVGHLLA